MAVRVGKEVVDDLDPALVLVVDAAMVREAVEAQLRVVVQERGRSRRSSAASTTIDGSSAPSSTDHTLAEARSQALVDRAGVHREPSAGVDRQAVAGRRRRTSQFSVHHLLLQLEDQPSVSASGRGGQPGT